MIKTQYILTSVKQHGWLYATILCIGVLASCTSDDVVEKDNTDEVEISFGNTTVGGEGVTRASGEGLENYVSSFCVYGYKTKSDGVQVVFPGYTVSYTANTANTTTTNTNDWEYVNTDQKIKYWDFGATNYNFSAVAGTPATGVTYDINDAKTEASYTVISLTSDNLTAANALYFTQPCKILPENYAKAVTLQFTPYLCKVRIGFYETMEDFSVQNLTFGDATNPTHLIATSSFVDAGTCKLTYDYANNTLATSVTPTSTSPTKDFGQVQYSNKSSAELTNNDLLGTASNNASFTLGGGAANDYFVTMLPYENNDTPISITCSYEAVQSDGTITKIKNIPATVPAEFAQWKPGYEYTYIFKISDTNIILDNVNQVEMKSWGTTEDTDYPLWNW